MVRAASLAAFCWLTVAGQAEAERLVGPAASAAKSYMADARVPCFRNGREARCTVDAIELGAAAYYSGRHAVVFVPYLFDNEGLDVDRMILVLEECGGDWIPRGRVGSTQGTDPADFREDAGGITYSVRVDEEQNAGTDRDGRVRFRIGFEPWGLSFGRATVRPD